MAYEIVVPRLGLTMEEGRIAEWFRERGETVKEGEVLFAVETDKVMLEVEAPVGGVVYPLPDLPSEPMPIGTLIGYPRRGTTPAGNTRGGCACKSP